MEIFCHDVCQIGLGRVICQHGESPGLAVMCGGGKCGSGENAFDNRIRYRVRFEAADRAASPQEGMEISGCQSELV